MNRRLIGLVVALALAGVATFLLVQWVNSADERAREEEDLAEVFVAQGDIPAGTSAEVAIGQALITTDEIPARSVPEGAIGSLDTIAGQVATVQIFDGEIIVAQRFGTTVSQPGGLFEIPEGLEAVTLEAAIVPGVAGFVQAQDQVSLVVTIDLPAGDEADDEETVDPSGAQTQYLVQDVTVLAVGQRVIVTDEAGEQQARIQESNETYLFTLAMAPDDIERAVYATQHGTIWFTLLPQLEEEEERPPVTTPGRNRENLFD